MIIGSIIFQLKYKCFIKTKVKYVQELLFYKLISFLNFKIQLDEEVSVNKQFFSHLVIVWRFKNVFLKIFRVLVKVLSLRGHGPIIHVLDTI